MGVVWVLVDVYVGGLVGEMPRLEARERERRRTGDRVVVSFRPRVNGIQINTNCEKEPEEKRARTKTKSERETERKPNPERERQKKRTKPMMMTTTMTTRRTMFRSATCCVSRALSRLYVSSFRDHRLVLLSPLSSAWMSPPPHTRQEGKDHKSRTNTCTAPLASLLTFYWQWSKGYHLLFVAAACLLISSWFVFIGQSRCCVSSFLVAALAAFAAAVHCSMVDRSRAPYPYLPTTPPLLLSPRPPPPRSLPFSPPDDDDDGGGPE